MPEGGFDRVLLKLSGEAFAGSGSLGVDPDVVQAIARQIAAVVRGGVEVAVVIGGGNFFRGAQLNERGDHGRVIEHGNRVDLADDIDSRYRHLLELALDDETVAP